MPRVNIDNLPKIENPRKKFDQLLQSHLITDNKDLANYLSTSLSFPEFNTLNIEELFTKGRTPTPIDQVLEIMGNEQLMRPVNCLNSIYSIVHFIELNSLYPSKKSISFNPALAKDTSLELVKSISKIIKKHGLSEKLGLFAKNPTSPNCFSSQLYNSSLFTKKGILSSTILPSQNLKENFVFSLNYPIILSKESAITSIELSPPANTETNTLVAFQNSPISKEDILLTTLITSIKSASALSEIFKLFNEYNIFPEVHKNSWKEFDYSCSIAQMKDANNALFSSHQKTLSNYLPSVSMEDLQKLFTEKHFLSSAIFQQSLKNFSKKFYDLSNKLSYLSAAFYRNIYDRIEAYNITWNGDATLSEFLNFISITSKQIYNDAVIPLHSFIALGTNNNNQKVNFDLRLGLPVKIV